MALFEETKESISRDISRRFRLRRYNTINDIVFPLTMRRIYTNGTEHFNNAIGTGFGFYSFERKHWFLVSNYHCFSGHTVDGESNGSFVPNYVDVEVRYRYPDEDPKLERIGTGALRYQLLDDDERKLYFDASSPEEGVHQGDIAMLPIQFPEEFPLQNSSYIDVRNVVYDLQLDRDIGVGEECFVVGFPRGLHGDGKVPIWKRATIASEPNNTYNGKLTFLVDTATRKGMSGSPVFLRRTEFEDLLETPSRIQTKSEDKLIGVYSGRVGEDELGVQLGLVWSIELMKLLVLNVPKDVKAEEHVHCFIGP